MKKDLKITRLRDVRLYIECEEDGKDVIIPVTFNQIMSNATLFIEKAEYPNSYHLNIDIPICSIKEFLDNGDFEHYEIESKLN